MVMKRKKFLEFWPYLIVFVTGMAVLVLEILGTRIVGPFYGTTVFVWTSLIVVTLGALSLGYWWGGRMVDKEPKKQKLYLLIFGAGLFFWLPMKIDQWILPATDKFGLKWGPLVSSLALFFIPLLLLGMVSPFVIRLTTKRVKDVGSTAGKIFALSTLGSIVGGLLAGFYLLDKLSISQSLGSMGWILIAIAGLGMYLEKGKKKLFRLIWWTVLVVAVWRIPGYVYKDTYTLLIREHEQSFYADLKVAEIGGYRCLAMNGSFQSCISLAKGKSTFTFVGETERLVEMRRPESMLLIGMGTGNVLLSLPEWLMVDVVELDPKLLSISEKYFNLGADKYRKIIFDDGRHFLERNEQKYDLVLIDTFLGNMAPSQMFSVEAIERLKGAVEEGGLVLINMEGKMGHEDEQLKTLLKTVSQVFPIVRLTVTEPERFSSVLIHLSNDLEYEFVEGGRFSQVEMDYGRAQVLTDDFNPLELISLPKLAIFRKEMINQAGRRVLFAGEVN